jgi:lysophospholipase L1-like esterase
MAGYIATLIADDPTYIIQGVDERVTLKGSDNGATYTFDGIHPNAIGYQAVADTTRTILGF